MKINRILQISIVLLSIGIFLIGCAGLGNKKSINPNELMVFPGPPDEPRIQYLRSFTTSSDIKEFSKVDQFLFGTSLFDLETTIQKPYGIAVDSSKIYICETMLPGLLIVNLKEKKYEIFKPGGRGVLRKPINVTLDDAGNIYVTDTGREQVVVFSKDLKYKYALSSGALSPIDVAISGDSLYVTDVESRNVEIWSIKHGNLFDDFPPHNSELPDSERVFVPYSIDVDIDGNVFVSDFGQFNIKKYSSDGAYLKTIGTHGTSIGTFARPKGIAVDREQNLYVVDAAFQNVQIFNKAGDFLMSFGGPYNGPGTMYLPAQVTISYDNVDYFKEYVIPGYSARYLIFVTNQFGPYKINVYGFLDPLPLEKF